MADTGLREEAVRYAAQGLTFEQTAFEDEDVVIVIGHDPENRRLRLAFNKARSGYCTSGPSSELLGAAGGDRRAAHPRGSQRGSDPPVVHAAALTRRRGRPARRVPDRTPAASARSVPVRARGLQRAALGRRAAVGRVGSSARPDRVGAGVSDHPPVELAGGAAADRHLAPGSPAVGHLLREDGSGKPYTHPGTTGERPAEGDYFHLPHAYWEMGLQDQIDLPTKVVLIVALSRPDDFILPLEQAPKWYGISPDSARAGLRQLMLLELLQVRTVTTRAPLSPINVRTERHYTLRPPFGPRGTTTGE